MGLGRAGLGLLGTGRKLGENGGDGWVLQWFGGPSPDAYTGTLQQFQTLPVPEGVSSPGDKRVS